MKSLRSLLPFVLVSLTATLGAAALPRFVETENRAYLEVKGEPFLVLGGELGNSSAADLDDLRGHWAGVKAMGLNTILAPVYWDLSEPVEGKFDWTLLRGLVEQARQERMHVMVLWFGAWKNSMSCYSPAWVKKDLARFPRVRDEQGRPQEIVTPFSAELLAADVRAYSALLQEVRALDPQGEVVLAIQVENEIGMLPSARDFSDAANQAWRGPVPTVLLEKLANSGWHPEEVAPRLWLENGRRTAGTWPEVFGASPAAQEVFSAWYYGIFVEKLVVAGKAVHALPTFVNAALIRPGYQPGQYPSAGPLPHLFGVWKTASPSVDLLCPDIYFPNYQEWATRFHRPGNPLFVPEALRSPESAINALYSFGEYKMIGFSPFAIESVQEPARTYFTAAYRIISQLKPWLTGRKPGASIGLLQPGEMRQPLRRELGGYTFSTSFERTKLPSLADGGSIVIGLDNQAATALAPAGGLVLQIGPDEFVVAGMGITLTFADARGGDVVGILEAQEGEFVDGVWKGGRWLNGDQTHQGRHIRLETGKVGLQRFKLYRYR